MRKRCFPLLSTPSPPPLPANAPPPTPAEPAEVLELRGALEKADKTSIFFGANLGEASIANRNALAHNLNIGIRNTIISKAGDNVTAAAEAVRVAADALSCATNVEFLGAASKIHSRRDGTLSGHYSMPVKIEFENKGARIHFECTMREKCDIRPSISLPTGIRKAQTTFYNELKE